MTQLQGPWRFARSPPSRTSTWILLLEKNLQRTWGPWMDALVRSVFLFGPVCSYSEYVVSLLVIQLWIVRLIWSVWGKSTHLLLGFCFVTTPCCLNPGSSLAMSVCVSFTKRKQWIKKKKDTVCLKFADLFRNNCMNQNKQHCLNVFQRKMTKQKLNKVKPRLKRGKRNSLVSLFAVHKGFYLCVIEHVSYFTY